MSMDKPNKNLGPPSLAPTSTPQFMPPQIPDPSVRGISWDQLLQQRGIRFIHRRAVPCPNMSRLDDNNHIPDCPHCDDSGIIYYDEREVVGVFQSNSIEKTFEQHGIWEIGSAVVTMPTEYADGTQADFNTYDELLIPDFTVRMWELKEYEPSPDNLQYLRYPVQKVDYLSVISNGQVKRFNQGDDFNVTTDGAIEWLPGKAPDYDNTREVGDVFSVSYYAYPVYKVLQPLRELRISQEWVNGQKIAKRLPQQILVRRDFLVGAGEKIGDHPVA